MHCMRSWMCSLSTTTSCLVYCQSSSMISSSGVSNKVRLSLLVGAENAGLEFDNIKPCCHCHVFEAIFRMPQIGRCCMPHAASTSKIMFVSRYSTTTRDTVLQFLCAVSPMLGTHILMHSMLHLKLAMMTTNRNSNGMQP